MIGQGRIFEDMSKVAGGALGAFAGLRGEVEGLIKARVERVAADVGLAPREDVEAALAMAAKAREAEEAMALRLSALEARVAELEARLTGSAASGVQDGQD